MQKVDAAAGASADRLRRRRRRRRGYATIWVIVATPAMLAMLVLVSEISNLWMARVELQNAVEAAALAGADRWGDAGADDAVNRSAAHLRARTLGAANLILGDPLTLVDNDDPLATNNNLALSAEVMLGRYLTDDFRANESPTGPDERACRVEASMAIDSLWTLVAGPFSVQAVATARYDSVDNSSRLVFVAAGDDPNN